MTKVVLQVSDQRKNELVSRAVDFIPTYEIQLPQLAGALPQAVEELYGHFGDLDIDLNTITFDVPDDEALLFKLRHG